MNTQTGWGWTPPARLLRCGPPALWSADRHRWQASWVGRFAQVKEEPAQRAGDTEQNVQPNWRNVVIETRA
ncbi:MAG: hypothetical protein WBC08_13995, partial [Rhodoferax sp.]